MSLHSNNPRGLQATIDIAKVDSATRNEYSGNAVRLVCYEIIWIRSGHCLLEANLKAYTIEQGTICCFAPGQVRKLKFSESIQALYFTLSPDFFYRICVEAKFPVITVESHHLSRPMMITPAREAEPELNDIIQNLQKELSQKQEDSFAMRDAWMRLFMMYLRRHLGSTGLKNVQYREVELVTQFLQLLATNFATKKMVSDYARGLGVTPNYLNLIVKRVSGFSASHHIQQFIILEAKREAVASVKSMKEIAYGLGFDDIAHFSKFFKNKSGTNFSDFKKDWSALTFHS